MSSKWLEIGLSRFDSHHRQELFSLSHRVQTGFGENPPFHLTDIGVISPEVKKCLENETQSFTHRGCCINTHFHEDRLILEDMVLPVHVIPLLRYSLNYSAEWKSLM